MGRDSTRVGAQEYVCVVCVFVHVCAPLPRQMSVGVTNRRKDGEKSALKKKRKDGEGEKEAAYPASSPGTRWPAHVH